MRAVLRYTSELDPCGAEEILDVPGHVKQDGLQQWAEDLLFRFNDQEQSMYGSKGRPRTLVSVRAFHADSQSHDWEKTNLVTIQGRGGLYDTAKCRRCGITAKRFGVSDHTIDPKFRAKVYGRCDTALAHLKKSRAR